MLCMKYQAGRKAIALSYYIIKVYEFVGFPITPERPGIKYTKKIKIMLEV